MPDEDRFISKRLNTKGARVDRVYELDEQDQVVGQWIVIVKADGSKVWNRVAEVIRGEFPDS